MPGGFAHVLPHEPGRVTGAVRCVSQQNAVMMTCCHSKLLHHLISQNVMVYIGGWFPPTDSELHGNSNTERCEKCERYAPGAILSLISRSLVLFSLSLCLLIRVCAVLLFIETFYLTLCVNHQLGVSRDFDTVNCTTLRWLEV